MVRRVRSACADVRLNVLGRIGQDRRWGTAVVLGVLCWGLLLGTGLRSGGAALGMLAAGSWGIGFVPVHSNRRLTEPQRRTGEPSAGEPAAPLDRHL
ncbi:hypothetical protein [Kitasatospora sp. GP82]|uniref:hypothetical protein n=1 Tax=Kitasatospora sp. GP82 TaxID=3035089 RepID=UPI002475F4E2|nr:hypothetical protein [Kitasatospora sp. GP82]MDH6127694.1 hypothetical protein [Kitasatospora sp. GP82]